MVVLSILWGLGLRKVCGKEKFEEYVVIKFCVIA